MLTFEQQRDRDIIREYGGGQTKTLRKVNTALVGFSVMGAVAGGATQLIADIAAGAQIGKIVKGSTFTVAGVSGTYTVAVQVESTTNAITITYTPALAGPAADNAAITWTQRYADWTYPCMLGKQEEIISEDSVRTGKRVYVAAWVSGNEPPEVGDLFAGLPVVGPVEPVGPDGNVSRYRITVGAHP